MKPEVKVTVTQKQYATLHNLKIYPQTKFGILASNNSRHAPGHYFSRTEARHGSRSSHSDQEIIWDTLLPKMYPHTKFGNLVLSGHDYSRTDDQAKRSRSVTHKQYVTLIPLFHTGHESHELPRIDFLLIRGDS